MILDHASILTVVSTCKHLSVCVHRQTTPVHLITRSCVEMWRKATCPWESRSPSSEYEDCWFNSQCVQCAHINHVENVTCSEHSNSSEGHIKSKIAYFVEGISYAFTTIQSCSQTPRESRTPLELKPHLSHSHHSFWWSSKVICNLPFLHNLGFLLRPISLPLAAIFNCVFKKKSHVVVTGAVYLCVLCIIITFASVHLRVCLKRILVNLSETSKCSCLSPWWTSFSDVYHDLFFNSGASQKKNIKGWRD